MSLLDPSGKPLFAPAPTTEPTAPQQVTTAPQQVTTAFLVIVEHSGRVVVNDDLTAAVSPVRKPSVDDVLGAAYNVVADMSARKTAMQVAPATAQLTIQTMNAAARQAMEAQQNAQVQQMLAKGVRG